MVLNLRLWGPGRAAQLDLTPSEKAERSLRNHSAEAGS